MTHREYHTQQIDIREHAMFRAAKMVLIALLIGFVLAVLVVPARAATGW